MKSSDCRMCPLCGQGEGGGIGVGVTSVQKYSGTAPKGPCSEMRRSVDG